MLYNFRYAKVKVTASAPIVPFRETIVPPPTVDMVNESIQEQNQIAKNEKWKEFEEDDEVLKEGQVKIYTPSKQCCVQIHTQPLPPEVTDFLDDNQSLIKTLDLYVSSKLSDKGRNKVGIGAKLKQSTKDAIKEFKENLDRLFEKAGKDWTGLADRIWAFGPKRIGPNLLINGITGYQRMSIWDTINKHRMDCGWNIREYDYSVVSGFQLATLVGPLCDEPMRGVCFIVEEWEMDQTTPNFNKKQKSLNQDLDGVEIQISGITIDNSESCDASTMKKIVCDNQKVSQCPSDKSIQPDTPEVVNVQNMENGSSKNTIKKNEGQGHLSGQLISIMKEACRKSFQTQPQRLMVAMYKCNIQATTEVLGGC